MSAKSYLLSQIQCCLLLHCKLLLKVQSFHLILNYTSHLISGHHFAFNSVLHHDISPGNILFADGLKLNKDDNSDSEEQIFRRVKDMTVSSTYYVVFTIYLPHQTFQHVPNNISLYYSAYHFINFLLSYLLTYWFRWTRHLPSRIL